MGTIKQAFDATYRDHSVDGVAASGAHEPMKVDIRKTGALIDNAVTQLAAAFVADAATLIYAAQSALFADLAPADRSIGIVYNDTPAKNGIYIKSGAAGGGSWSPTGLLLAGPQGEGATVSVGTVSNGSAVSVVNRGSPGNAILDFVLRTGKSFYQSALDTGYIPAGTTEAQFIARISTDITAAATAQAKAEADRAEFASELSVAASLTLPGVLATIAEGLALVAEAKTFWAAPDGDPTLFRKVSGQAARIISMSDIGQARSTIKLSRLTPANGKLVEFLTTTAGSPMVNATKAIFASSDVGKRIRVSRAGPASADLFTTIASYQSPTRVTLAAAATSSTSSAGALLGTDCGPALQTALNTIFALGGGTILIDGLFYWETPVLRNFGTTVGISLSIVGTGWSSGLLVAGDATKDMATIQNCPKLVFSEVNFAGSPMAATDCRRLLNLEASEYILERSAFFGMSVAGPENAGLVYARRCRSRHRDNEFGGCIAQSGIGTNIVDIDDFSFVDISTDRFLDYGRFQGALLSKTGMGFCFSWIRVRSPLAYSGSVNAGSVVRVHDCNFDEGHFIALFVGADVDRTRVPQVHLSGNRTNNTLLDGGVAYAVTRADNVKIEQTSIGWANTPHDSLLLIDCSDVEIDGVHLTDGAPVSPFTGMADGLTATNIKSLTLKNAQVFKRRFFTNVGKVIEIEGGQGGVLPFTKAGRITDADFRSVPPNGTVAVDTLSKRLYIKVAGAWLATAQLVATTDPAFTLTNITPATGALDGPIKYSKTAGGISWANATANLQKTMTGGFRMRVRFPAAAAGHFVRVGAVPASYGASAVTGQNDIRFGVMLNNGSQIYVANDSSLVPGPFTYAAGQEVQIEYNSVAGTYRLLINGVQVVAPTAVPANVTPTLEHRFSSTIYNVGAGFELLEYGPL